MTARRARVCAVLVLFGWFVSLVFSPLPGEAAGSRALVVQPATGLENQVVHASWSGFHPTVDGANTVTLYQCKGAAPASLKDCYTDLAASTEFGTGTDQATTGDDGTGSQDIEIRPGLQLPQLGCSATNACSIVAFENDGSELPKSGLPATAVTAPLTFAPSPSDCPTVATPDVTTEGEASASHALYSWSARVCNGNDRLSLDYTESSSPAGRDNFLKGLVDVGLTSTAPTAEEISSGPKRSFTVAPIDLTGVVVAFNVSDTVTHERINDMNLTPRLVAIMIAGGQFGGPGQTLFSDPEFVANNPGHHWPDHVEPPLLRSEKNADAYLLTGWLNSDGAARNFLDGKDRTAEVDPYWKKIAYPTDVFEARDQSTIGSYNPRNGTLTNARRLFNFQPPGDAAISPSNDAVLGVLDAVTARKFGLPAAKLRPANGGATGGFVAADGPGLTAGYHAMKTTADKVTKVPDTGAAGAYPLTKIDYALVPTSGLTKTKAVDIGRFLTFAGSGGQSAGVLSAGYVPLPADLRAQTATAQQLVLKGATSPPGGTTPEDSPAGPPASVPEAGGGAPGLDPPGGTITPDVGSFDTGASGGGLSSTDSGAGAGFGDATGSTDPPASGEDPSPTTPTKSAGSPGRSTDSDDASPQSPKAISAIGQFGGADGQHILPLLLGTGIAALLIGPGLRLWLRRKGKRDTSLPVETVAS